MNALRAHRLLLGLTQRQLSVDSGVHASIISAAETGRLQLYDNQRERLAAALGVQADTPLLDKFEGVPGAGPERG